MPNHETVQQIPRRRQDPVSCRLCRSKKLKCNRQHPCSNCVARGMACELPLHIPIDTSSTRANPSLNIDDNAAILGRLQALEDMVSRMQKSMPPTPESVEAYRVRASPIETTPISEVEETHHADARKLEVIATKDKFLVSGLSDGVRFMIHPISEVLTNARSTQLPSSHPIPDSAKCISVPTRDEADWLFWRYAEELSPMQHIIYIPHVQMILENFYEQLKHESKVIPGHAALMLSIFASSACLISCKPQTGPLFTNIRHATACAISWFKAALDVMEHSRRGALGCLEDVQASIILFFLLFNLEGFSARARSLHASALAIARELSLHKTDDPRSRNNAEDDLILVEIKRRIWWHIASSEWIVSVAGGPQEGSYHIDPRHMKVKLPRHINEDDFEDPKAPCDRPVDQPTTMSYFLQRVRVAELCRCVADTIGIGMDGMDQNSYDEVLHLDSKFQKFLDQMPIFLRLDDDSVARSRHALQAHPLLAMQRYVLNFTTHNARCKLHQAYLVRSPADTRFNHSKHTCVRSAQVVLHNYRLLAREKSPYGALHLKLSGPVHHLFFATIILVMDLCFNKTLNLDDPRVSEVRDAFTLLETAKQTFPVATRFLESLFDVLNKHKVQIGRHEIMDRSLYWYSDPGALEFRSMFNGAPVRNARSNAAAATEEANVVGRSEVLPQEQNEQLTIPNAESDFDSVWRDFIEQGPNLDLPDWDLLLSEIDSYGP